MRVANWRECEWEPIWQIASLLNPILVDGCFFSKKMEGNSNLGGKISQINLHLKKQKKKRGREKVVGGE
jgi:hypothetical protein